MTQTDSPDPKDPAPPVALDPSVAEPDTPPEQVALDENPAPQPPPQHHRRRRHRRLSALLLITGALALTVALGLGVLSLTGATIRAPDWVKTQIETRVNAAMNGGRVSLDALDIVVDRGLRPRARVLNVGVFDGRGAEIARLNELRARLAFTHLLRGAVTLKSLSLSGAQITLRRNTDGRIDLSLGTAGATSGRLANVLDGIDRAFQAPPLGDLSQLSADALTITLEDSRSGRIWQVTDGAITLDQSDDALDLTVTADVFNGTEELATTVIGIRSLKGSSQASLTATFENAAAADIAAQSPALSFLAVLDAPISGALRASIDTGGDLDSLDGTLDISAGAVQPTPEAPPIRFDGARAYVSYDPAVDTLRFSEVTIASDTVSATAEGTAFLQDFNAGWPETLVGQFALADATLQPKDVFAEPMKFARGAIDFRLRLKPFTMEIGQVALQQDRRRFNGKGRISVADGGWNVALDLGLNTISLERLLALWPVSAATGTRNWLERNVSRGDINDLAGAFRFGPGREPTVSLSYLYSGTDVQAVNNIPPITDAGGYASLNGTTYTMVIEEGHVTAPKGGKVDLTGSVVSIADVSADPARARIDLRTESSITAVLSLLDQPPRRIITDADLPIELATGRAKLRTDIGFDLLKVIEFEDVDYTATGQMLAVRSDVLIKDRVVSAAALDVRATPEGVTLAGAGKLGAVPTTVSWRQDFGPEAAGISRLEGSIELSQAFLDEFNIGLPDGALTGAGTAQLEVDLVKGQPPRFELRSDLNRVGLSLSALDWTKARNQTGTLEVLGRLGEPPSIDRIAITAPGLSASGVVDLGPGGVLRTAQFDRVRVGGWLDGPVTLTGRGARPPAVSVSGGNIDMRAARFGGDGGGSGESGPLELRLNRLTVSEGITLTDFRGSFREGRGLDGRFTANVNNAAPITGTVVPTPAGSAVRLVSDRAGAVLAAADVLKNARGGALDLTLNPSGRTGTYDGRLKIKNTRIVQAPAMTELLSAISIVGLLDQMNSGGISLADVEAEFRLSPERLTLYRSSAVGPSLGISLDGLYDLKNSRMDMQGVISPVYFLNGIGQIFSRGRDGLFGFNFRLSGDANNPRVNVNPLSILTPGMFREIFRRPPPDPN